MRMPTQVVALGARYFAIALLALVLSACSRTVTWEEEVPLNTGETIWIEREMPWAMRGGLGNPFDISMRPTRHQTIRFHYADREYVYSGRANVRWIAITTARTPVLVAPAADFAWDANNNFFCSVPHYVQLIPSPTKGEWTWPASIDPWLYGLSANVMATIPAPTTNKARYTAADRNQRDAGYRLKFPQGARIDPTYKVDGCLITNEQFRLRRENRSPK